MIPSFFLPGLRMFIVMAQINDLYNWPHTANIVMGNSVAWSLSHASATTLPVKAQQQSITFDSQDDKSSLID